jgi:hypothetical protein
MMKFFIMTKDNTLAEIEHHEGLLGDQAAGPLVAFPVGAPPMFKEALSEAIKESDDFAFYLTLDFRFQVKIQEPNWNLTARWRGGPLMEYGGSPVQNVESLFEAILGMLKGIRKSFAEKLPS